MSDPTKSWKEQQGEALPKPVEDTIAGATIVVMVLASPVLVCLMPLWMLGLIYRKLVIEKQEEPKE